MPLMRKMNAEQKPVISNFFPNFGYTKAAEFTHNIKGVTIYCGEANHNDRLKKFTMPMEFVCPTGDKKFVFFTSGDCYNHEFLNKKSEKIDLYAIHPRCGMIPVNAAQRLNPELTFIGHLQELGHEINVWRWQLLQLVLFSRRMLSIGYPHLPMRLRTSFSKKASAVSGVTEYTTPSRLVLMPFWQLPMQKVA